MGPAAVTVRVWLQCHLDPHLGGAPRCQHVLLPADPKSRAKDGPRQCRIAAMSGSLFCCQHQPKDET